jgi:hypothetical protein
MRFYWLALGILALWRVTHLLNAEDGPADLLVGFRRALGTGLWGKLLDCFLCLSLWLAVPFAFFLGETWKERLLLWPALSAGAIILERWLFHESPPVQYVEDEPDAVLRESAPATSELGEAGPGPGSRAS